jgi:hypothetical protein
MAQPVDPLDPEQDFTGPPAQRHELDLEKMLLLLLLAQVTD